MKKTHSSLLPSEDGKEVTAYRHLTTLKEAPAWVQQKFKDTPGGVSLRCLETGRVVPRGCWIVTDEKSVWLVENRPFTRAYVPV